MEIDKYRKAGLYKKPKKQLLNLLGLKRNKEILINFRIFPSRSIFKNDIRERHAKYLVLTTERIFIVNRGWIIKEVISFDEITDVLVMRKWQISTDVPVIIIKTINDSYEIFFYGFFSKIKKIKGIIDCIKERNPNINLEIDLKEDSSIRDTLFTKIKFK